MVDIEKAAEIVKRCALSLKSSAVLPTFNKSGLHYENGDLHIYGNLQDGGPVVRVIIYKMEYVYTVRAESITIEKKYLDEVLNHLRGPMLLDDLASL
jgi:hypothetical protein